MKLSGWGRYPVIQARPLLFRDVCSLSQRLNTIGSFIPFGNGRSYGDSALADFFLPVRPRDRMLAFDTDSGLLTCEAGVLLSEIIETFSPKGWFPKVVPGTKLITVGGAIAADVHGKNHHQEGCFGDTVKDFLLMPANGEVVRCSRTENRDLFLATCGGMGLTGIILSARFYLKKINSRYINQITIKTKDLKQTFDAFEKHAAHPYSVAWIDCLADKKNLGRALLTVGEFCNDGDLAYRPQKNHSLSFDFPEFALNRHTVKIFNKLYYSRIVKKVSRQKIPLDKFFFPLDSIDQWNRMYGKTGFIQYQFILPESESFNGLTAILEKISVSRMASFLSVLKLYGPANENYLSFPLKGYSLALDFKIQTGLFDLLNHLDTIVLKHRGRIYLAKDARVSRHVFEQGYPCVKKFRELRVSLGLNKKFNSLQSKRLGL
jgi:FAD/FMN-containing dehydrogenase